MKVFTASMAAETNTFSTIPTGFASFQEYGIHRGDGSRNAAEGVGAYVASVRSLAERDGHEVVESIAIFAQPAGRIVRSVYEAFRDEILADLSAAMPVDMVQLMLHGAMVAEGYDDCEGDILARVRTLVGPDVAIGVLLDLHCHFTEKMRVNADAIICFKEYPHVDGLIRSEELYAILVRAAGGEVSPVTAVFDCEMVGLFHTTREPMASFVRAMANAEGRDGILSVSFGHGFPWGDIEDNGSKIWVIADRDFSLAEKTARTFGQLLQTLRDEIIAKTDSIETALAAVTLGADRPTVIADVSDNAGGGAPGDTVHILRHLLDRETHNVALGAVWDPGAVHVCRAAGVGARFELRLGGKCGKSSGDPIDLVVTVKGVREHHSQRTYDGRTNLGSSVWVEVFPGFDILVSSVRSQIMGRDAFTDIGIDLDDKSVVVVKSAQHFYAEFCEIAEHVFYVSAPGAVSQDFGAIPYKKRSLRYWPKKADLFAAIKPSDDFPYCASN